MPRPHRGPRPADYVLRSALREAVRDGFQTGKIEDLSVKHVRSAVESQLALPPGWFKSDERWNTESKEIIVAEFVRVPCCRDVGEPDD